MAFGGTLGHLAHPATTPVWGPDKCSAAPRHMHTVSAGALARARSQREWEAHAGSEGTDALATVVKPTESRPSREQVSAHHYIGSHQNGNYYSLFFTTRRKRIVLRHPAWTWTHWYKCSTEAAGGDCTIINITLGFLTQYIDNEY